MDYRAGFCIFRPPFLTPEEAQRKLSLYIPGYPLEEFKYIEIEDVAPEKYLITSYGRVFTSYGKELFPDYFLYNHSHRMWLFEIAYLRNAVSKTGQYYHH